MENKGEESLTEEEKLNMTAWKVHRELAIAQKRYFLEQKEKLEAKPDLSTVICQMDFVALDGGKGRHNQSMVIRYWFWRKNADGELEFMDKTDIILCQVGQSHNTDTVEAILHDYSRSMVSPLRLISLRPTMARESAISTVLMPTGISGNKSASQKTLMRWRKCSTRLHAQVDVRGGRPRLHI